VDRPLEGGPIDAETLANQSLFRQKASNPQASLQPWLAHLLDATDLVRCYATEDANPTKQLKNKLSQAAAARGGLLVLMLADDSSFSKAREALLERWMTNAEWPKSVACVALAYPLAAPTIEAIIERTDSPWAQRLRNVLFPSAEVFRVKSDEREPPSVRPVAANCSQCDRELPPAARFCPHCGRAAS
jgi:zinc-ribbon domain